MGVEYDMESVLASCAQRYFKLCEAPSAQLGVTASKSKKGMSKKHKKNVVNLEPGVDPSKYLTVVTTPFINDSDQKDSPQGAPCDHPNHPDAVTCPWCLHRFVKGKQQDTPSGTDIKSASTAVAGGYHHSQSQSGLSVDEDPLCRANGQVRSTQGH